MSVQIALICESKAYTFSAQLLFEKVAGIPLLLRNILLLKKIGVKSLGVVLPNPLVAIFEAEVAPELKKRGIEVALLSYDGTLAADQVQAQVKIPAQALVDPNLPSPFYHVLIDEPSKIKEAEKLLLEKIRLSTPGPIARHLNKRISLPISLRLARWGFHPNWITLVNMVLGVASGVVVAEGTYNAFILGGFMFQMASVFDGCDGEVAKLTFTTSKFGQYFDTLSDNGALLSFFAGLFMAYAQLHTATITSGLAILFAVGLGGLLWQMIQFLKKNTNSASLATFDKEYLAKLSPETTPHFLLKLIQIGKTLMRKDCFSLLIFISALFGILPWWLYLATASTWIANGVLLHLKQLAQNAAYEQENNRI